MRAVALDVHRDFCEVAIVADGRLRSAGRIRTRPDALEACWSTVRQPGPIAGFYERIRVRRGHSIAIVASARKLACLFWCLLTREEDYAFAQPSLTKKKMCRLELTAEFGRARATTSQSADVGLEVCRAT